MRLRLALFALARLQVEVERAVAIFLVGLLAQLADDLLAVGDPQAVAVGQAHRLRQRGDPVAVLLLLDARELAVLLLVRPEQLLDLAELRQVDGLFAGGQVALQRREGVLGGGHVREDGRPVVDLGLLDRDGGLELLVGAHDRVRRHLAEVAGEHRVAAALLDLLVARLLRLGRRERVGVVGIDLGHGRLELLLDGHELGHGFAHVDHIAHIARADGRHLALEVVVHDALALAFDLVHGRRLGGSVLRRDGGVVLGFAHGGFLAGDRRRHVGGLARPFPCSFRSSGGSRADGRLASQRSRPGTAALASRGLLARLRLRHSQRLRAQLLRSMRWSCRRRPVTSFCLRKMISAVPTFGRDHGVVRYYAAEVRRVLRTPAQIATLALASAMHAAGHALVALVAGSMAVAMARMWGMRGAGSIGPAGPVAPASDRSLGDQALVLAAVGLGVLALKAAAGVYATYVQGRVAGEVGGRLRLELLDALLSHHRLRRPGHGDQGEAPALAPASPAGAASALTDRAQLVPLALVLVVLSPRMAAVAFVVLGVFGVLLGRSRRGFQRATSGEARERAQLLEAADEAVRHADLWVSYGAEAKARARVRQLGEALALGSARLRGRAAALSGANEVLGAAALLLAIADGPTLLAFAVAFFLAYRPLRELADARLALARADGAYRALRAVIGPPAPRATDDPSADATIATDASPVWTSGTLELRDLRLARGACRPLSLRVEAGSVVAIAGPTGIGKTTLLRTLLGLESAAGGDVVYDGRTLGEAPAGPLARPFAWVPQDAPLLADTLAENVAMGSRAIDPRHALDPLGASHLASALDGARLGSGGRAVSGGERQWIALARAIATRQPVLLLDEPTSGLDALAQGRVLDAIHRLKGKRTVLMVTHRPEPLEVADVVVRL